MNTADLILLARVQDATAMEAAYAEAKALGYAIDGELPYT